MDGSPDPSEAPAVQDLTPEEASRIISSHRKVRYGTACWPCRQRKVRCDAREPCANCIKREHPQLCSYRPNQRASSSSKLSTQTARSAGRKRTLSPGAAAGGQREEKRQHDGWSKSFATTVDDSEVPAPARYLGQNSIPALLREQNPNTSSGSETDIRSDMRPILGLDTSAPFPLMSTRHLDRMTRDITSELPSDREVMKLFRTYKEVTQPFWGIILDIEEFESNLMLYLEERAKNAQGGTAPSKPISATWLAILFGILAVGSQYHDSPYHIRTRDAQKYIQIAFHFLRIANFLLRPTFDSIQALLLICFGLLNDMKAEASWALLGLTCRLAQSLGLHRPSPTDQGEGAAIPMDTKSKEMVRRRLWWTCTWHDTLISLSFDRAPVTNMVSCEPPFSSSHEYGYLEGMYSLMHIISRRITPDSMANVTYDQVIDLCSDIQKIPTRLVPRIRQKDKCKTVRDRLQHFAISLHTAFVMSVACRPALRRDCPFSPEQKAYVAQECKRNLILTVKMFLAMHQLSVIPTRSWAFTYNGLSSALLLGILVDAKTDPEIRQLQGDLIAALSATAAKVQEPEDGAGRTDKDIELSGPLWRALMALRNIYRHGSVAGPSVKKETGREGSVAASNVSGVSQGPTASGVVAGAFQEGGQQGMEAGDDPAHDAARTMAELQRQNQTMLQQGAQIPDYNSVTPTQSTQQPMGPAVTMESMVNMEPSPYMSPLDLYESIWWETPEPWNTGFDAMNFEFSAQPPPGQQQQPQSGYYW